MTGNGERNGNNCGYARDDTKSRREIRDTINTTSNLERHIVMVRQMLWGQDRVHWQLL